MGTSVYLSLTGLHAPLTAPRVGSSAALGLAVFFSVLCETWSAQLAPWSPDCRQQQRLVNSAGRAAGRACEYCAFVNIRAQLLSSLLKHRWGESPCLVPRDAVALL